MRKHKIYILLLNGNPVYVGRSTNVKNRISFHKKTKKFDSYVILKSLKNKEDASFYERGIIDYMTLFNINSKNSSNNLIEFLKIIKI